MTPSRLEEHVREQRRRAWSLAYRMLGTAPAADLAVHDALRALAPSRPSAASLGVALERGTLQLARERLRRRRQRGYVGPWLPSPVDTWRVLEGVDGRDVPLPGARWSALESGSYSFLLALEGLSPRQRAVALLCDALGRSEDEAAKALELTPADTRDARCRAHDVLERYERSRCPPGRSLQLASVDALGQLLACLGAEDIEGLSALLADDAEALGDGGGDFVSPRVPVRGAERIAGLLVALVGRELPLTRFDVRELNGLPALVISHEVPPPGHPPRLVLRVELDLQGRVAQVHVVLAKDKLAGLDVEVEPPTP
jgi:RNA polymerase sigma-70 factor (ECF subfamily)